MRNNLFIFLFSLTTMFSFGQINPSTEHFRDSINKWTIEAYVGQSKGIRPYSPGYFTSNPDKYAGDLRINHFNAGVRYMISPKFGFKLDLGFDKMSNNKKTLSLPFEVQTYTVGIQGVINVARLLNLEDYLGRFGILVHAGGTFSMTTPKMNTPIASYKGQTEDNGGIIFGVSPQYRITPKFSILADLTLQNNIRQHYTWDGALSADLSNLSGQLVSMSLGLSYSFGREKIHGDWAIIPDESMKRIEPLEKRIGEMETLMNDTDKDGVPDYLDTENNTTAGVAVDTKGRAIDLNGNGVPDELESYIENKYSTLNNGGNSLVLGDNNVYTNAQMKSMINGGYVNVFFDFDKSTITPGTISAINFLIKYLNANPTAKSDIIGYADAMGDKNYNMWLAETRATKVREMIVRSGIAPERLNLVVKGADNSVPKESKLARQLVRRVAFEVK